MAPNKISAKEFSSDVKSGMTGSDLIIKYNLSEAEKLHSIIEKLISNNFLKENDVKYFHKGNICPSCGAEIGENKIECQKCGIVFSKYKQKTKKDIIEKSEEKKIESSPKNKKIRNNSWNIRSTIILIVLISITSVSFLIYNYHKENKRIAELKRIEELKVLEQKKQKEKAEFEYNSSFFLVTKNLFTLAKETEDVVDEIQKEWRDSIFDEDKKRNFNVAIKEVYFKRKTDIAFIKSLSKSISSELKEMIPKPEKENEYRRLKEIYLIINKFANMAISPTGNLQAYSMQNNELTVEIRSAFKEIELMDSFPKT